MFTGILLFTLPNFLLIFLVKCVDQYAYKKYGVINKAVILPELILILLGHIMLASLEIVIWQFEPATSLFTPILLVPIFATAAILLMRTYERNKLNDASEARILTKSLITNLTLSMVFNIAYGALMCWDIYPVEYEIMGKYTPSPTQQMKDTVLWVGVVGLLIVLTLIKVIAHLLIAKCRKKNAETE